jgi:hypothetical protein
MRWPAVFTALTAIAACGDAGTSSPLDEIAASGDPRRVFR